MTVIELPDGTLRRFSRAGAGDADAHRLWDPKYNDRGKKKHEPAIVNSVVGKPVLPASLGDVWISDGLARYSEELYAEQISERGGGSGAGRLLSGR